MAERKVNVPSLPIDFESMTHAQDELFNMLEGSHCAIDILLKFSPKHVCMICEDNFPTVGQVSMGLSGSRKY